MNPLLTRENQGNMVRMLKAALKTIGREQMEQLLQPPLMFAIQSHDTGCQAQILCTERGRQQLYLWEGSIWYDSFLTFNDENKILGMNPAYDFAEDALVEFFETVQRLHAEHIAGNALKQAEEKAKDTEQFNSDVDYYRQRLGKKKD